MAQTPEFAYDPEILSRISSLKIHAMNVVDGLLSGQHKSPHKGSSVEFAEYKNYSPGDDIRHIDWKVFGKTDKVHVKQFEQTTNLKCTFLLDTSGSMAYCSPFKEAPGLTKADYARTLVAALSYLFLKQFDAVGLTTFSDKVLSYLPPRSKPSHFQDILHGLAAIPFGGNTRMGASLGDLMERLPRRGLVVLVSDLLCREDDVLKTLKLVASRGQEVILFHILHHDEVEFPFVGDLVFESLEDDLPVELDALEIRDSYQKLMRETIAFYKKTLPSLGIDYLFLETTTPLDQALRYYLLRRRGFTKS